MYLACSYVQQFIDDGGSDVPGVGLQVHSDDRVGILHVEAVDLTEAPLLGNLVQPPLQVQTKNFMKSYHE